MGVNPFKNSTINYGHFDFLRIPMPGYIINLTINPEPVFPFLDFVSLNYWSR